MVLSDADIRRALSEGQIRLSPLDDSMIQPASIDVRLGTRFRVPSDNHGITHIDVRQDMKGLTRVVDREGGKPFVLYPGEAALGRSVERLDLGAHHVARLEGKSSLGRLGLMIHSTAGFIDPGFGGTVTLELSNVAKLPIALYPGMPIGQLCFMELLTPALRPYGSEGLGSKYQGQVDPEPSRMHRNFGAERAADLATGSGRDSAARERGLPVPEGET